MPQYFDSNPSVASATTLFDVVLPDVAYALETDRGVFSHGHLDTGTGLLLREAAAPPRSGHLLDLGCGAGPIALAMALRAPDATVWAIDVNARARDLVTANAARNGITNLRVADPGDVPGDVRFAAIWTNPPIRIGKAALHALLLDWFARLEPAGTATLVVQKHLGADSLQHWLDSQGMATQRRASRQGFRVLECRRAAAVHDRPPGVTDPP